MNGNTTEFITGAETHFRGSSLSPRITSPKMVLRKGSEKQQAVISLNESTLGDSDVCKNNGITEGFSSFDPEPYSPFDNRDMSHATPDFGALMHMLKCSLGSGILAMPNAFKNGGSVFGFIGTIVIGIICTHCVQLLVFCSHYLSVKIKKPSLGFPETAEAAFQNGPTRLKKFAPFAREFVTYCLLVTHYLGNTAYVVLMSASLQQVVDNHYQTGLDIRIFTLIVAIPLIPVGSIRSLKYLVPFSTLATGLIIVGLVMTLYFIFLELPPVSTTRYFGEIGQLPIFFSTVLFAMEGIGTVLPIENSMKNPNHFLGCPGVLNIAMTVVVTLYAVVGFFGYVRFGEATKASITLNLGDSWVSEAVIMIVAVSILFTYGLQFTVPSEIIWKKLSKKINEKRHTLGYYTMRILLILGTVVIAVIIPQLGPFMSLVGAICFSTLGLLCPSVLEMVTLYDEGYGFWKWRLVKDIIIIILFFIALISGTYSSLLEIIAMYNPKSKG